MHPADTEEGVYKLAAHRQACRQSGTQLRVLQPLATLHAACVPLLPHEPARPLPRRFSSYRRAEEYLDRARDIVRASKLYGAREAQGGAHLEAVAMGTNAELYQVARLAGVLLPCRRSDAVCRRSASLPGTSPMHSSTPRPEPAPCTACVPSLRCNRWWLTWSSTMRRPQAPTGPPPPAPANLPRATTCASTSWRCCWRA